jgi:formylmethanofuran dehydrogenase subunit E
MTQRATSYDGVLQRMQVCENCDRLMVKDEAGWIEVPNGSVYCPKCAEPLDSGDAPTLDELLRYDLGSRAVVRCSDCGAPIPRDDSRAPDGRLICDTCVLGYLGSGAYEEGPHA